MYRTLLLALSVAAMRSITAQTTTVVWSPVLPCGPASTGYLRPRVQVNADGGPVVLWNRDTPAANFVSVGNGTAFSTPVRIHPEAVEPALSDWQGSSHAADGNTIWAVMKSTPEHMGFCYVVRSDDGGYTWGDTMRVEPADGFLSRFPSVAVATGGEPVVQYMQLEQNFGDARYVVSHMMGGMFMPPVQASALHSPGYVCDCCPGQVVATNTNVLALYRNAGQNIRTMWGASSTDAGMNFDYGAELDATNWELFACPSSGPDGYVAGDSVRYVWMSGETNGNKVFVGSAHLPELTPGPQYLLFPDQPASIAQNYPRISGSADTLGVVWQQSGGGNSAILFSYSVSGLTGLSAPDTLATGMPGQMETPDIQYGNGAFHIVWSDQGPNEVHYQMATLQSTTALATHMAPQNLAVWPQPANDHLVINQVDGVREWVLLDASGKRVQGWAPAVRINLSAVAPGSYVLLGLDEHGITLGRAPVLIAR